MKNFLMITGLLGIISLGLEVQILGTTPIFWGTLYGLFFGVFGYWNIQKLAFYLFKQDKPNKGMIFKWSITKFLVLLVAIYLVIKLPILSPLGFILGYGCVLLAIIFDHLGSTLSVRA